MLPAVLPSVLGADAPVELTREQAAELARRELADPAYHSEEPLIQRAIGWLFERIGDLVERIGAGAPGGWFGVLGLLVLAVVVVAVVRWRMGPVSRSRAGAPLFLTDSPDVTAQQHRDRAGAAAARGAYDEAVRERLRAVIRELEERGVLDPRPGRTADEAARAAGAALPGLRDALVAGAARFDRIWYGGAVAGEHDAEALAALDRQVQDARPVTLAPGRS